MKYNLITDLSATSFPGYTQIKDKLNSDREIDYKNSLFFEASQTLDEKLQPPYDISAMKFIYSRQYKPYELFTYPYNNLHFKGHVSAGTIHSTSVIASEIEAGRITCQHEISTDTIVAKEGTIKSISSTSITASNKIESTVGYIREISGDLISSYTYAKFGEISVTGIADMVAARAQWADLAEMYQCDNLYDCGTLVEFAGEDELTLARTKVNGCLSEKPALVLNAKLKNQEYASPLVLMGKTKVKVVGKINKFDKIELSDIPGIARRHIDRKILGIALESNMSEKIKLVECILKLTL